MRYSITTITYAIQKLLVACDVYQIMCWPIQDAFSCRLQIHGSNKSFPADTIQERLWFVDLCDIFSESDEE